VELRVGELEEVEERHQREIHHLYDDLAHERAKATRLEAERDQHKQDAQDYLNRLNQAIARANQLEASFQDKLEQYQHEQALKMQELAKMAKEAADNKNARNASSSTNVKSAQQILAEQELMARLLKEKADELRAAEARSKAEQERLLQQLRDKDAEMRTVQTKAQVEQGKMALKIKELEDVDSQSDLRLAQFKARFNVQDERIGDMDQQLSSLYTAFGIIKQDQDEEAVKRATLQINLNEADEEMARHMHDVETSKTQEKLMVKPSSIQVDPWASPSSRQSASEQTRNLEVPRNLQPPSTMASSPGMKSPQSHMSQSNATPTRPLGVTSSASSLKAPPRPGTMAEQYAATPSPLGMASSSGVKPQTQSFATPLSSVDVEPYIPSARRTPGTWELLFPEPGTTNTTSPGGVGGDGLVIKGILLVKSKSVLRQWKSKFCKLYRQRNHYQWDMEGKSYTLGYGISKVEFNPNHPLSFIVFCNPFDEMAPVVYAATSTESDYRDWMQALTQVTSGRDYEVPSLEGGPRRLQAASLSVQQHSGEASVGSILSAEEQEAADLERALRISQTMK
jgi:hypothetical protein